jgi:hypothetical protein
MQEVYFSVKVALETSYKCYVGLLTKHSFYFGV